MVVLAQKILYSLSCVCAVGQEDVCVVLILVVSGCYGICRVISEVVGTSQKGITQYAVTVTGVVERVRRSDTAVYPVTLICDMDGLACMYETAVLCTAAVEVLAAVLNQALCGLGSERKRCALLHYNIVVVSYGHFCGIFIKCNLCLTSCDYNISILIGYFRLRVAVLIGRIRILWNLRCVCCVVYGRIF